MHNTPHLQGYVELLIRQRGTTLKAFNWRVHWEARRGSVEAASEYCQKGGCWASRGLAQHARRAEVQKQHWEAAIAAIQAKPSMAEVLNDPTLGNLVAHRLAWAKAVHAARPFAAYELPGDTPGLFRKVCF